MSASILLLVLSMSAPTQMAAEASFGPQRHAFELGIAGGALVSPSAESLADDPTAGQLEGAGIDFLLRLSYSPFRFLGVEAEAGHVAMDVSTASETGMFSLRGHVMGQLPYRWAPFVLVGGGVMGLTSRNEAMGSNIDPAVHYGAGLEFFAMKDVSARLDVRHNVSLGAATAHHVEILGGVSFTLISAE